MKTKQYFKAIMIVGLSVVALQSCVKTDDYAIPQISCADKFGATNHTLVDLAALGKVAPTEGDKIATDFIVEAYVSSNDESGNIYKTLYIQDAPSNPTQAIEVDIDGGSLYTYFPLGSKVKINAKGLIVQKSNGNVKLGSYDPSYAVGRINPNLLPNYMARMCGNDGFPVVATMIPVEFNSFSEALKAENINKLVKINNVQFRDDALGTTTNPNNFTDSNSSSGATDRPIVDKKNVSMVIRNSTYANFANTPLRPKYEGSGSITMILSLYSTSTWQGYIRDLNDLNLNGTRFAPGVPEPPAASAVNLFTGSDFENWATFLANINTSFGLKPYATQGVGLGYNGTNSLQLLGTTTANDYVFTAKAAPGLPAVPKRITMYIKGTATGKSLSFNVNKTSGSPAYYPFNLGTFATGAILDADPNSTNSYTGSINTNGQWKLIELNLTGLTNLNLTAGSDVFSIKTGSAGTYNLQIDNIKIE